MDYKLEEEKTHLEQLTDDTSKETQMETSNCADDKDSYLNRDEFSSEHFKLEIKNLPKNFGFGVKENRCFYFKIWIFVVNLI